MRIPSALLASVSSALADVVFQLAKLAIVGQGTTMACGPQLKQMRKEVADLLRANKQENARIRVETVIRENLTLQVRVLRLSAPIQAFAYAHLPKLLFLARNVAAMSLLLLRLNASRCSRPT